MKNIILTLSCFLCIQYIQAQIVNIPDVSFKAKLIANGVDTNADGEIQLSEAEKVSFMNLNGAGISDLTGLEAFSKMISLKVNGNPITSLNPNIFPDLIELECSGTQLTSLTLNNITNIDRLTCTVCPLLVSLSIVNCPRISTLICYSCNLSVLDISNSGITKMGQFDCYKNQITSLDISGITQISTYNFGFNKLTSIDFSDLVTSNAGFLNDNNLTSLDFHKSTCGVFIQNNDIEYLYIKDAPGSPIISGLPKLKYICTRESEITSLQNWANSLGYNCQVNSYCSFTPGGTYYSVEGQQKFDEIGNGCNLNDFAIPHFKFNITSGTKTGVAISDGSGSYLVPVNSGNHVFVPSFENYQFFNINPPTINVTFPGSSNQNIQDICVSPAGIHNDVEVILLPVQNGRPGFDAEYKLVYKNKGNQNLSGEVQLNFDDVLIDFVSSSQNPSSQLIGILTWSYADLKPFEKREFLVTFNLNSPMENPPLNSGDKLNFTGTITPTIDDETPADNNFNLKQIVVNSFDPNDKKCLEGDFINPSLIGEYLNYIIRFENLGTTSAVNVVVKDVIDTSRFIISSLVPTSASHDFTARTSGDKVEFFFQNINLPYDDANNDGYISFKIQTKPSLQVNDEIKNKAEIFFDFNFPIVTNEEVSVFKTLGIDETLKSMPVFAIIPSIVYDQLTLIGSNTITKLDLINSSGQTIQSIQTPGNKLPVNTLQPGIYYAMIYWNEGMEVKRFVKI